jgi:hypothetical protein
MTSGAEPHHRSPIAPLYHKPHCHIAARTAPRSRGSEIDDAPVNLAAVSAANSLRSNDLFGAALQRCLPFPNVRCTGIRMHRKTV